MELPCGHGNVFGCPQCADNEKKRNAYKKAKVHNHASNSKSENLEKQAHKDKGTSHSLIT